MRTPRRLTNFARTMRKEPTEAERRMWYELRDRRLGGWKFRRQVPLAGYILDFYCNELRLSVELDGSQHYDAGTNEAYDAKRTADLEALGVTIVRFENPEFMRDTRACVLGIGRIADELAAQGPHPDPLPGYRERGPEPPANETPGERIDRAMPMHVLLETARRATWDATQGPPELRMGRFDPYPGLPEPKPMYVTQKSKPD
jgi:very-short-patch-repair endonuclease